MGQHPSQHEGRRSKTQNERASEAKSSTESSTTSHVDHTLVLNASTTDAEQQSVNILNELHTGPFNFNEQIRAGKSKRDTPSWVQDAVFYQIFPDRFASSPKVHKPSGLEFWDSKPTRNGFKGGDLLGVAEKLSYLKELGVTAIYLCPIFQSACNHRYHTHDYHQIDPLLGGARAFEHLLAEAHAIGMKVILDGVFNHASRGFFQFNHILECGEQSPYTRWFKIHSYPVNAYYERKPPTYAAWWNLHALPQFNHENAEVREFIYDVGTRWIQQGIDGWRLDVPNEVKVPGFWEEFRRRVRSVNPDAYLVGEIWGQAQDWIGSRFDGTMNYLLNKACIGFFAEDIDASLLDAFVPPLDATSFADIVSNLLTLYPAENVLCQLNLMGSHDTARFLSLVKNDISAVKLANLFLFCYPGAPCIYYGDEVGMEGAKDPDCRRAFVWDESRWNMELLDFFKWCCQMRSSHSCVREGEFHCLHAEDKVVVCARGRVDHYFVDRDSTQMATTQEEQPEHNTLVFAFNTSQADAQVILPHGSQRISLPDHTVFIDLWATQAPPLTLNEGKLHLTIPARGFRVFKL
eukprot:GILK01007286.1.p1 GENE.GILK01007286.1~~GILK01007286.1.p1  ORF type:complete len:576 (-),score=53.34 GILK01007286.1:117-1844(-)